MFPVQSVAEGLREQLLHGAGHADDPPIRLRAVLYSPEMEAWQTAAVLACELGQVHWSGRQGELEIPVLVVEAAVGEEDGASCPVPLRECSWLGPKEFKRSSAADDDRAARWLNDIASGRIAELAEGTGNDAAARAACADGNAVLVIGHQPYLGWLSDALRRPQGRRGWWQERHSRAVPLSRSEVVCLAFQKPARPGGRQASGRILWTISADDSRAAEEVRGKIRSKMDTARMLSGVMTFALGALLAVLLNPDTWAKVTDRWAVQIAAGLLLVALTLYLATMYAYDRLLMPDRFWGERRPRPGSRNHWLVQRPPSSAAWVLYVNMMRVWRGLFSTATVCVVTALAVLAGGVLQVSWLTLTAIVLPAAAITTLLIYHFRPVLGSED